MLEISRKNSNVNNLQGSGKYPESERGARGPRCRGGAGSLRLGAAAPVQGAGGACSADLQPLCIFTV